MPYVYQFGTISQRLCSYLRVGTSIIFSNLSPQQFAHFCWINHNYIWIVIQKLFSESKTQLHIANLGYISDISPIMCIQRPNGCNTIMAGNQNRDWKTFKLFIFTLYYYTVYSIYDSMTFLLTHNVAHSTRHSFRPKTNNQPIKKFLSLAFSWVKVVKNWTSF